MELNRPLAGPRRPRRGDEFLDRILAVSWTFFQPVRFETTRQNLVLEIRNYVIIYQSFLGCFLDVSPTCPFRNHETEPSLVNLKLRDISRIARKSCGTKSKTEKYSKTKNTEKPRRESFEKVKISAFLLNLYQVLRKRFFGWNQKLSFRGKNHHFLLIWKSLFSSHNSQYGGCTT